MLKIASFIFSACQEDINEESTAFNRIIQLSPEQISDASYEDQKTYAAHHLNAYSKSLYKVANDPDFHRILYQEANKGIEGESAVLLSTIFEILEKEKPELLTKMTEVFKLKQHQNSSQAFSGIDGKVLYPQLYIPFFAEINDQDKTSSPVIMVDPLDNQEIVNGYTIDADNNLVEVNDIDERYAQEHEVWVVSLHETIAVPKEDVIAKCYNSSFCYPKYKANDTVSIKDIRTKTTNTREASNCFDGNTFGPRYTDFGISVFFDDLILKRHFEPWYDGASQVNIILTSIWESGYDIYNDKYDDSHYYPLNAFNLEANYLESQYNVGRGQFARVSRKNVSNKKRINLNK